MCLHIKAYPFEAFPTNIITYTVCAKTDDFEPEEAYKIVWELASYEKMFDQVKEKSSGFVFKREAGRPKDAGCFSIAEDSD